jgi:hypothetical protein
VHVLSSAPPGSAWTFGGAILTFVFPMILFIVVAGALYVLYTKPELVPGHQVAPPERPVSYTAVPGWPAGASAATTTSAGAGTTAADAETSAGEAARIEDGE